MPARRGLKRNHRAVLHPDLIAHIDALERGALGTLAREAGFPHQHQFSLVLRHPFPIHPLTLERLGRLAIAVGYAGPLIAPEADHG